MPSSTYVARLPGPFAALLQAAELGGFVLDPLPPVRVRDTYLDTETGALLAEGAVLRARTMDGETTLTLRPMSGDGPAYEASGEEGRAELPPGDLAEAVAQVAGRDPLAPILRLRQYRTPRIAYDGERLVGLVSFDVVVYELDDGHVVANEVEIEFEDDVPDGDLQRFDRVLCTNGLERAGSSKMERGLLRARRSLDQPVLLLPDERAALVRLRERGTAEERRRAQVMLLDARGFSTQTIADQARVSPSGVDAIRQQFRAVRMDAMRSGTVFDPRAAEDARAEARLAVSEFEDLDALLDAFHAPVDETPDLVGPPMAPLRPVPVFVPDVGWERSAALAEPPPPPTEDADADWLDAPRFEPVGQALMPQEDRRDADPADDLQPAASMSPSGVAAEGVAAESSAADDPDARAEPSPTRWVDAAVAPAEREEPAPTPPSGSWLQAALAPALADRAPWPATRPATMWSQRDPLDALVSGASSGAAPDPFAALAVPSARSARVDGETPILEAAWLTIGHQVAAFESATDALFQEAGARQARRLFLSAHRVRLALESFAPYLPDRAVERMTGALRRLVQTLDAALDYDRAASVDASAPGNREGDRPPGGTLAARRDACLGEARDILEGGRQRAWGHRSRRLLGRLQAQGRDGLLIGDDFPAAPDDFIGEVGDRPVPSRLKHVLGSLVWHRYEDVLAFENDIDGELTAELAYHFATAVSGLHFVLGLAETTTPEAARELARVLDQAEALAAAFRHERRTAELTGASGGFEHGAAEVREVWRLLASPEFRQRLALVAVGA